MKKSLLSLSIFILSASILNAGNTGKIAGKIVDENNEPLPFANIIVIGTTLGGTSDEDGNYFIINISPGTYTLKASYVGYTSSTISGVKVSVDRTTPVDFQLNSETLNLESVVVVANQPLIIKDKTSSVAKISSEEIEELPVQEVADVIKLQAGVVVGDDGRIHIRGGRSNEISYMVNGISITDPYSGEVGMNVENNAVQELTVVSGTFNAEYGQAQSGIINIVTKEGGQQYTGSISTYLGSYYTNANEYINLNSIRPSSLLDVQAQFNGPIPGLSFLGFFLSGRYFKDDGYIYGNRIYNIGDSSDFSSPLSSEWYTNPTGDSAFVSMNSSTSYSFQGSLKYQLSSAIKLLLSGSYNNREYREYDHAFRYDPDGDYRRFSEGRLLNLSLTHVLSQSTFYEIKVADFQSNNKYYTFENPVDPRYPPESYIESKPYNFKSGGAKMDHLYRESNNRTAKFELNSQADNINYIKVGFDVQLYNLLYNWYRVINNERTGFTPSVDPNIQGPFARDDYDVKPIQYSGYIQDKIEIEYLIVNAGIRFDYFNSKYVVPEDFQNPTDSPKRDSSPKKQISPRLGIAYPISDRGVLHFSYGHFFQIPPFEYLYYNPEFEIYSGSLASLIGNANLEPEQTVSYEFGLQQQLTEGVVVDATAFYKDIRNL
ncbi:MAG: TonB-dependent receptor, partial [Ignavibacteria bacterium]